MLASPAFQIQMRSYRKIVDYLPLLVKEVCNAYIYVHQEPGVIGRAPHIIGIKRVYLTIFSTVYPIRLMYLKLKFLCKKFSLP